jgi:hypothetical protein
MNFKYIKTTPEFEKILDSLPPDFVAYLDKMLISYYEQGAKDMKDETIKACANIARSESYYSPNVADDCLEAISNITIKFKD